MSEDRKAAYAEHVAMIRAIRDELSDLVRLCDWTLHCIGEGDDMQVTGDYLSDLVAGLQRSFADSSAWRLNLKVRKLANYRDLLDARSMGLVD